jgi:hypothetical protein
MAKVSSAKAAKETKEARRKGTPRLPSHRQSLENPMRATVTTSVIPRGKLKNK